MYFLIPSIKRVYDQIASSNTRILLGKEKTTEVTISVAARLNDMEYNISQNNFLFVGEFDMYLTV